MAQAPGRRRPPPKPSLLVVSAGEADVVGALFGRRGFEVTLASGLDDVNAALGRTGVPASAIVDYAVEEAAAIVDRLAALRPRPVLVGIGTAREPPHVPALDAGFARPVNAARLFARVVLLLGKRKTSRRSRITGVVAVVRGNRLFHQVEQQLWAAVPSVNAGAILEEALEQAGVTAKTVTVADVAALLSSGRLLEALERFSDFDGISRALDGVRALVKR